MGLKTTFILLLSIWNFSFFNSELTYLVDIIIKVTNIFSFYSLTGNLLPFLIVPKKKTYCFFFS